MTRTEGNREARTKLALQCPGLVGDIIRQLNSRALHPIPTFCAATALATVGALRGAYRRTTKVLVTPSNLFFCCLARSGGGKDFPRSEMKKVLDESCASYPIDALVCDQFRSAQGMHLDVAHSGGIKIFLHDEAHTFFSRANKKEDTHTKAVKDSLVQMYSRSNDSVRPGRVVGRGGELPTLWYPSVSYVGFGVPTALSDIFNETDSDGGWLNRVILIIEDIPIASLLDGHEKRQQQERSAPYQFQSDPRWLNLIEQSVDAALARRQAEKIPRIEWQMMELSSGGFRELAKVLELDKDERIQIDQAGGRDYRARFGESVLRVAGTITEDGQLIGKDEIEWAYRFVDLCLREVAQHYEDAHDKLNPVIQRIERALEQAGWSGVPRSALLKKIKIQSYELDRLLDVLVREAKAVKVQIQSVSGKGRPAETWFAAHHFDARIEQERDEVLEC